MNTIVKIKFGSHLYGTNTPQSDTDYKGIYLPSLRDVYVGKFKEHISYNTKTGSDQKNSKEDIDYEVYSLHYFLDLACAGETVAIDMIHAPKEMILISSPIWEAIQANRHKTYSKNIKAFVGYARTQAAKYGIKGSRLNQAGKVIEFLSSQNLHLKINDIWEILPEGEHISKTVDDTGVNIYQVCGKKFQGTATIKFCLPSLNKYYSEYGARAKLAANNEGIDWKAVSHALRAAFQVKEMLTTHDLKFPLKEREYLLQVKQGRLDFKKEVGPRLDKEIEELEILAAKSDLPEKVDRLFWDDFLCDTYLRINNA